MKLKLYFLLAIAWASSALGMGVDLNPDEILSRPRFIEIKNSFEEIGGMISIQNRYIYVKLAAAPNQFSQIPCDDLFLERLEKSVRYYRELWWRINLPKSLKGLCILRLAEMYNYNYDNLEVIAGIVPEDLKEQVLLVAGKIRGAE